MRVSKQWIFALAIGIGAASAQAEDWRDYKHTSDTTLVWRRSDHKALTLNSDGRGVDVVSVSFEGLWGLHKGDHITSLDNTTVHQVSDFLDRLPRTGTASLAVINDGKTRSLSMTSEPYQALK